MLNHEYELDRTIELPKGTKIRKFVSPDGSCSYIMVKKPEQSWKRITELVIE